MNVGGLCPLKIKQSWVIQEKKILFFLNFQFEHQFFGRIFMLFLILWATNMVKLLISFPTPCLWVSHPTKIYFCLRTVLSSSLVLSLEMPTHTWTNDGPQINPHPSVWFLFHWYLFEVYTCYPLLLRNSKESMDVSILTDLQHVF